MRDGLKLDRGAEVWAVGQDADYTAIIGLEKLFEHQAGEQLVLGELLRAETVRVGRQGALCCGIRGHHHTFGGFASPHTPNIGPPNVYASRFSTEHSRHLISSS